MTHYPPAVEKLIDEFARLPGIGRKSAARLAFFVLSQPPEKTEQLAQTLLDAKSVIRCCTLCQDFSESEVCPICDSETRDKATICVVSEPRDVFAIERTREYNGLYHVLHGVISPLQNVSPDDIRIRELLMRVGESEVHEVIMATNPDTEGEATALYIARLLRPFELKITRLAYGIPMGGHLEFTDEVTLSRALEGRRDL